MRFPQFAVLAAACALASPALAAPITVSAIGDHGWTSLDTRSSTGANLTLPSDASAINQVIQLGSAPPGGSRGYGLHLQTSTNSSKASFGVNNLGTGFGSGTDLLSSSFFAEYEWLTEGSAGGFTARTSPLKIGIQSSGFSPPAMLGGRTNEENWDYILVHDASGYTAGQWETESITNTSGNWFIYRSGYIGGGALAGTSDTLANLASMYGGSGIFDSNARIVSLEFGVGSGQANASNYVSYLRSSLINGGDAVNFAAPEPSSLALMSLAGLGFVGRRWRRRSR
jgi:hypothetical protein